MGATRLLVSLIICCCFIRPTLPHESPHTTVVVGGSATIAKTNVNFVCATIDWWPPEKCNYNQCPWGEASVLNLNLTHPLLAKAIRAFEPLRIRIGGSLQDQVVYETPSSGYPCHPFSKKPGGLFGFSQGCLSMQRWDQLNQLFLETGAIVTFGLNALQGRHVIRRSTWGGAWNSSNAKEFIRYTASKSYPVDSWEFGNELSGSGVSASVGAEQYGKDLIELKAILGKIYENTGMEPLLVAPGGFFDLPWFAKLLKVSGSGVLDAMSHHIYNLGGGDDPHIQSRITDPKYLSRVEDTFRNLQITIQRHGPWSSAWVGEAGGAYNSGSRLVSNTFLDSIWYLDQLGMASRHDTKVYCRQTLIGGNYGLLDTESYVPNPDYYSALLWHRLMGSGVLSVDTSNTPYLRAYAHCRKNSEGVSLLLINLDSTSGITVTVRSDPSISILERTGITSNNAFIRGVKWMVSRMGRKAKDCSVKREEYHLTAKDGNQLSRTMLLNGKPLELPKDGGDLPPLDPAILPANSPAHLNPLSIVFLVFPKFEARACDKQQ